MNVDQMTAVTPAPQAVAEELLEQLPANDECLLRNLLCKHKTLKMKLENASKAKWTPEQTLQDVVHKHIDEVEELLTQYSGA